jgi:hypothetical protein
LDRKWTNIIIWPRDRASISVQQLRIEQLHARKYFMGPVSPKEYRHISSRRFKNGPRRPARPPARYKQNMYYARAGTNKKCTTVEIKNVPRYKQNMFRSTNKNMYPVPVQTKSVNKKYHFSLYVSFVPAGPGTEPANSKICSSQNLQTCSTYEIHGYIVRVNKKYLTLSCLQLRSDRD